MGVHFLTRSFCLSVKAKVVKEIKQIYIFIPESIRDCRKKIFYQG